jgi:hypothetical protein
MATFLRVRGAIRTPQQFPEGEGAYRTFGLKN